MALLADAGHNLSDVLSLLLAWGASRLAAKRASHRRTYGFRRVTIMASLVSAILLLTALGGITWEAIQRFADPKPVDGLIIIIVAGIGVVINTATALLFRSGQKHDLNIKGAYLHMAADAAVSLGVVLSGAAILATGWLWLDPVISLLIVFVIFMGTWGLLQESLGLSIDAVPRGIDMDGIRAYLSNLEPVAAIHDLHVWALSTTETALTVHLVLTHNRIENAFLETVQHKLHDQFQIAHATIQVETQIKEGDCRLDCSDCI
jgi:cobalt-zinc-cadmium efflux system protein